MCLFVGASHADAFLGQIKTDVVVYGGSAGGLRRRKRGLDTVFVDDAIKRRLVERLATAEVPSGALRSIIDGWFFGLEQEVLEAGTIREDDQAGLLAASAELAEQRLSEVARTAPAFAAALRHYRLAAANGDSATAEGLLAWVGGQPHVAAGVKRGAGIKGDLDHDGALAFLSGLCVVLRDAGYSGLVVVLDEGSEAADVTVSFWLPPSPQPPARTAAAMVMAPRPSRVFTGNSSVYWWDTRIIGSGCEPGIGEM